MDLAGEDIDKEQIKLTNFHDDASLTLSRGLRWGGIRESWIRVVSKNPE